VPVKRHSAPMIVLAIYLSGCKLYLAIYRRKTFRAAPKCKGNVKIRVRGPPLAPVCKAPDSVRKTEHASGSLSSAIH